MPTRTRHFHSPEPSDHQIDVMVPVARKDMDMLPLSLGHLVRHCRTPIRKIYVVWQGNEDPRDTSPPQLRLDGRQRPVIEFVNEQTYGFTLAEVEAVLATMQSRENHAGWYYQQLLKLYGFRTLPGVLPRLLIHDADVAFMAPVDFLGPQGRSLLSYGYPFRWLTGTSAYGSLEDTRHSHITHARRLVPGWKLANVFSGMQHHQVYEQDILESMLVEAERAHGMLFWEAFIRQIDPSKWNSASEYVLYFHYALGRYPDRVSARHLNGIDLIHDADHPLTVPPEAIAKGRAPDMVGRHGFISLRSRLESMDYIPEDLRQRLLSTPRDRLAFRLCLFEGSLEINPW